MVFVPLQINVHAVKDLQLIELVQNVTQNVILHVLMVNIYFKKKFILNRKLNVDFKQGYATVIMNANVILAIDPIEMNHTGMSFNLNKENRFM